MLFNRLRKLYFHGKLLNQFTQKSVLSADILSERKLEFILPHLEGNFQINARNKLQSTF